MRSLALASMAVAVQAGFIANSLATVDDNRAVTLPGVMRFPVRAAHVDKHRKNGAVRRQASSELVNQQAGTQYLITLTMGEPGTQVQVDFDTGSNELWVNPDCTTAGDPEAEAFCKSLGHYEPGPKTVKLGTTGGVTYGKGKVKFDYVKDSVGLGGAKIVNQTFGMATFSEDLNEGIMGAGPDLDSFDKPPYPMVVDSLAQQGIINARAFSVDLRSVDNPRGAVIFGGADTKKFSGKLAKSKIITPGPDGAMRYWISMDGLTVTMPDGTNRLALAAGKSLPIFPDTGATLSHLPRGLVDAIAAGFPGAEFDEAHNQHTVPCNLRKQKDASVNFKFGEALIKVPFSDFIWEPVDGFCLLGAVPTADNDATWSLGDSFLRAAYAVFDQDNKNVWLAQSADCGTNLVSFDKGINAVKPLEGDCGKPPVTSSSTTSSSTTTTTTTSPTSSSTEVTTTSSTSTTTDATTSATSTTTGVTTSSSVPTTTDVTTSSVPTSTGVTTSSGSTITSMTSSSVPTGTGITSMPWSNMTTTAAPTYTSTYLTTTTYTITSCAPTVTNCPVGHVTTEVITSYTTWCPGEATATNPPAQPTGGNHCPGPNCNQQPGKPTGPDNSCPGPNCNQQPGKPNGNQPGCPGPNCGKPEQPGTPLPVCPGPNCNKPSSPAGGSQCPGGPNCPAPQPTSTGANNCPGPNCTKPSSPAGGSQCPGGANCPHPTGGMTTVSKPCATCGSTVPTGKPTPPVVTGAASEMFRVSGVAAVAAAIAALIL